MNAKHGQTVKVGPFTWVLASLEESDRGECWDLVRPAGAQLTFWCVKNYGGKPNDSTGFSGWRLVSGGPFCEAGGWTSRDAAMRGVIPYLMKQLRKELHQRIDEANRLKAILKEFEASLKEGA